MTKLTTCYLCVPRARPAMLPLCRPSLGRALPPVPWMKCAIHLPPVYQGTAFRASAQKGTHQALFPVPQVRHVLVVNTVLRMGHVKSCRPLAGHARATVLMGLCAALLVNASPNWRVGIPVPSTSNARAMCVVWELALPLRGPAPLNYNAMTSRPAFLIPVRLTFREERVANRIANAFSMPA